MFDRLGIIIYLLADGVCIRINEGIDVAVEDTARDIVVEAPMLLGCCW